MENLKRAIEILLDSARTKLDHAQASRDFAPICTIKQLQDAQHKIERAIEFVYLDDWNIAIKENDMGDLDEEISQYSIDWKNALEENTQGDLDEKIAQYEFTFVLLTPIKTKRNGEKESC